MSEDMLCLIADW